MVVMAKSAASTTRAWRHPTVSSNHASIGMKIVLAKPATSVTTRIARSRPVGNHCTTAENAGS